VIVGDYDNLHLVEVGVVAKLSALWLGAHWPVKVNRVCCGLLAVEVYARHSCLSDAHCVVVKPLDIYVFV
jgi:hypothetical protein